MSPEEFVSLWSINMPETKYPELKSAIQVDVAIVGGGMAGITAAYFLMNSGLNIAMLEAEKIVSHTSGNTTAKITSLHEMKYAFLKKNHSQENSRIYAESNQWAIDEMEKIIRKENIDCDFERISANILATTDEGLEKLMEEYASMQELGIHATFSKEDTELPFQIKGKITLEKQAMFHPKKFLFSLAELASKNDVKIFQDSRVIEIEEGEVITLKTHKAEITAKKVIITTNYPTFDKSFFFMRMNQRRSYALAAKLNSKVPNGMYINIDGCMLTFRPHESENGMHVVIGGKDYVTGDLKNVSNPFEELEKSARELFDIKSIEQKWAAQDAMPIDRVPYIGRMLNTKNIFVATGFGEWGMTTSIVSAKILSDLIHERENAWTKLYSPSRIKASLGGVTSQISHVAKGFGSYVSKTENYDSSRLALDEGKIMSRNGKKIAVYKDETGVESILSAKCTHMGCIVNWNRAEKSWDCQCHGSRFDVNGKILNSPATKPLNIEPQKS